MSESVVVDVHRQPQLTIWTYVQFEGKGWGGEGAMYKITQFIVGLFF